MRNLIDAANYVRAEFGAEITIIPEPLEPTILAAAASKIRALHSEGRHTEADLIEYTDIPTLQPVHQ